VLQVVVEHSADTVILRCVGRIVAGDEAHVLQDAVANQADKRGLGLLVFLQILSCVAGFDLKLLCPSARVREMLEIAHLDSVFEICTCHDVEAMQAIAEG